MAFIQVYINGTLDAEIPLQPRVTTIGRGADCDIRFDNSGISELHARIRYQHGHHILEDAQSRNGILLNGQRVTSQELVFGDELTLLKHRLKFIEHASGALTSAGSRRCSDAILQDETVEVDLSSLQQRLQASEKGSAASLILQGARGMRSDYPISKVQFTIGRSQNSDLYMTGLLAPARAACIQRRSDGYFIEPGRRGKVRVNGKPIQKRHRICNGDGLQVRHMTLCFRENP